MKPAVIIGKQSARRATILGRPFIEAADQRPAVLEQPGAVDGFQAMVDLTDLCHRTEGEIEAFGDRVASDPSSATNEDRTGIFTNFAGQAQGVLNRMAEGPGRKRAGDFARAEGFRLMDRAATLEEQARAHYVTSQLDRFQRVFAANAAADPAKAENGLRLFSRLVDASGLSPEEAQRVGDAGAQAIRSASLAGLPQPASQSGQHDNREPIRTAFADASRDKEPDASLSADIRDVDERLGRERPSDTIADQFTPDDQAALRSLARALRDNGAPDEVIEATLSDVTTQAAGRRRTAMEPFSVGALSLGALALTALAASSLEAQRRRAEQADEGSAATGRFDRLIEAIRPNAGIAIEGGSDDEEADPLPAELERGPATAAAPQPEPPPNPEDDPLFNLMMQTIAGQIVEQAVRERPELRAKVRRHTRDLLPQVRELYPDGVDGAELERIVPFGREPGREQYRPQEVVTAVLLERKLGVLLERSTHEGVDWIDSSGATYDGILGNMPAERYTIEAARRAIKGHVRKSVDHVVVDLHKLGEEQANEVEDFINTELPASEFSMIIILR